MLLLRRFNAVAAWLSTCGPDDPKEAARVDQVPIPSISGFAQRGCLKPEPEIRSLKSETRNPKPETRNPKPVTLNPEPGIQNPKPETRDPKPETRNLKPAWL